MKLTVRRTLLAALCLAIIPGPQALAVEFRATLPTGAAAPVVAPLSAASLSADVPSFVAAPAAMGSIVPATPSVLLAAPTTPGADEPAAGPSAEGATPGEASSAEAGRAFDGGSLNGTGGDIAIPVSANGTPLNKLYSKVVFIQDVFNGPAPDAVAANVNRLIKLGVHVVFMTWRPQKGPGSADEILLSRVDQSRNNPVVVVSYNGGKISLHGRAANPKSIIENVGNFDEANIALIRAAAEKAAQTGGGSAVVTGSPTDKEAFSLTVTFKDAPRAAALRSMNAQLKKDGLPYKAEAHPDDAQAVILHSMPLRYSLPRVIEALESQFPDDELSRQPEKYLVMADSMKSPRFATSFPNKAEVKVVQNGAAASEVLSATLGDRSLPTVSIKLGMVRQFIEYWEPGRAFRSGDGEISGSEGGGGAIARGVDKATNQMMAMYVGTVINRFMAALYENIRNGQHQFASTAWAVEALLEKMWRFPLQNGVYVNKKLAAALAKMPSHVRLGYFMKARAFVSEFWRREFSNYTTAANNVMLNLVSLNTDRKSAITLEFRSNSTGQIYKVHTRIPRVMKQHSADGLTLVAHAYKTGKQTSSEGEEFLARMYAMAMLRAHGRKGPDGKWHMGSPLGEPISKLIVQYEYLNSPRPLFYDASEFDALDESGRIEGPIVRETTSAIERMLADDEYQQYYREHEAEATKEDMKKSTPSKKPKNRLSSATNAQKRGKNVARRNRAQAKSPRGKK